MIKEKINLIFIAPPTLTTLWSWKKKYFFFTLPGCSPCKYLFTSYICLLSSLHHKLVKKISNKIMCNLKFFFIRNFSWLPWFTFPFVFQTGTKNEVILRKLRKCARGRINYFSNRNHFSSVNVCLQQCLPFILGRPT